MTSGEVKEEELTMKIFMTGGTGFVGTTLTHRLLREGNQVTILTRKAPSDSAARTQEGLSYVEGDPTRSGAWQESVPGHDVVINLAGASIFRRWNRETKDLIRQSRVQTTTNLVDALAGGPAEGTVLLSTSAVGYYGFHNDEELDEESPPGEDFLATVTRDWEAAANRAQALGVRVILCRFGIVLGKEGGALAQLIPLFQKGLGSPLGSGRQWLSWIHEEDLVGIYLFLMGRGDVSGPVNCTAPNPVTNRELTHALGKALGKPTFLPPVPGFIVKVMKGEFGTVLLNGQRVLPKRLLGLGFRFRFPDMGSALKDLVG